jgi:hypothetical protein
MKIAGSSVDYCRVKRFGNLPKLFNGLNALENGWFSEMDGLTASPALRACWFSVDWIGVAASIC